MKKAILLLSILGTLVPLTGQQPDQKEYIRAHYAKFEYRIAMRDGVRLFTAVYAPNDRSRTYPILLYRTPYSSRPYGPDRYRSSLGPTPEFARDGYIFVYQDVRGRYMSEGEFVQLTPHLPEKLTPQEIDESTDTYDTIEWLVTHLKGEIEFWNQMMEHPRYDSFWSKRGIVRHLKNVRCAVMTVGGWFDAEDLYGPLRIYRSVERNNPDISNVLVMGPWAHGDWGRRSGAGLGNARFGYDTSDFYRERIIRPFFRYHLKQEGKADLPEAYVFETGANRWRTFDSWPPPSVKPHRLYLRSQGQLSPQPPETGEEGFDEYVSDPAKPVPFSQVSNIFKAKAEDFIRATHRVYRSPKHPTQLKMGVIEPPDRAEDH